MLHSFHLLSLQDFQVLLPRSFPTVLCFHYHATMHCKQWRWSVCGDIQCLVSAKRTILFDGQNTKFWCHHTKELSPSSTWSLPHALHPLLYPIVSISFWSPALTFLHFDHKHMTIPLSACWSCFRHTTHYTIFSLSC